MNLTAAVVDKEVKVMLEDLMRKNKNYIWIIFNFFEKWWDKCLLPFKGSFIFLFCGRSPPFFLIARLYCRSVDRLDWDENTYTKSHWRKRTGSFWTENRRWRVLYPVSQCFLHLFNLLMNMLGSYYTCYLKLFLCPFHYYIISWNKDPCSSSRWSEPFKGDQLWRWWPKCNGR